MNRDKLDTRKAIAAHELEMAKRVWSEIGWAIEVVDNANKIVDKGPYYVVVSYDNGQRVLYGSLVELQTEIMSSLGDRFAGKLRPYQRERLERMAVAVDQLMERWG